jgi:acetoin utilization deacetylase AcuC-like enzyme
MLVYVAGADPYHGDKLGALKLTIPGLRARDELVLGEAAKRRIPSVVVLAGGYAEQLSDTVEIHTQTCRVALETARSNER